MAKNAVSDWSTTAASNTDIGGIDIDEGCAPSGINNAIRELMEQIATFITSATYTGTSPITLTSTDAGAAAGPILTLYRNSASPAASDIIGQVLYQGEDSAGNTQDYAAIDVSLADVTSTTEDATIRFRNVVAGTMTTSGQISATGYQGAVGQTTPAAGTFTTLTTTGAFTSLGIDDNAAGTRVKIEADSVAFGVLNSAYFVGHIDNDQQFIVAGYANQGVGSSGGSISVYGPSHATKADDVEIAGGTNGSITIDSSASTISVSAATAINVGGLGGLTTLADTVRLNQSTTSTPGVGNNTVGGACVAGAFYASAASAHQFNRTTDATVVQFSSGGTQQGSISISGATTSYNPFFGSHFSQLMSGTSALILRGTICESLATLSDLGGMSKRLPRFKTSDTPGSKAVYGVFAWWDQEEPNKALIGALGAFWVRIDAGQIVQIGDYIESAGNGCGRVQADDILRSSTVAKVTSTEIIDTYPDGSYLVPCTLHCG